MPIHVPTPKSSTFKCSQLGSESSLFYGLQMMEPALRSLSVSLSEHIMCISPKTLLLTLSVPIKIPVSITATQT